MIIALAGNQNSGKTTLFNQLTGANQRVGNFPGVTVEKKTGDMLGHKDMQIVDLPGIYSLSPYSSEEIVTRDFLLKSKPQAIINLVDATNIERNLYLTLQLIELQMPMVLALNMMDEIQANKGSINTGLLEALLGIPVVPISAAKKQGLTDLTDMVKQVAETRRLPSRADFCSGPAHRAIHAMAHLVEDHALAHNIPIRFAATRLVEGDDLLIDGLGLSENEIETIEHIATEMEKELDTDRAAALADMRYQFIEEICGKTVKKPAESREYRRSVRIDSVLTHKIWAIPVFLGIMFLSFWLTFGVIGEPLGDGLVWLIEQLGYAMDGLLTSFGLNPIVHALIIDGVFAGVGAVLSFLPLILTLFFFLSIMEDSGYMARVAFVLDKLLRKIGLSGRSSVPLLMGFGCTVPAVMATRTLSSERDRKMTILLTPFMSCGAKIPIYAIFSAAFFPRHAAFVMMGLYLLGILLAVATGLVLKKFVFKGDSVPFVMELPNYRFPSPRTVLLNMWNKAKGFIRRAFTLIFAATVVIWFLQSFDTRLFFVEDSSLSMLADLGRLLSVVLGPIGMADWRMSAALVVGLTAKEASLSALAVLTGSGMAELSDALYGLFSSAAALSFMVFTLLYTPCVAAVAIFRREYGNIKGTLYILVYLTVVAWVVSAVVYQLARLIL